MSPRAMDDFIVHVADTFSLDHSHVVGPDVGTSASLFAAAVQPGRFSSLVAGTGRHCRSDSTRRPSSRMGFCAGLRGNRDNVALMSAEPQL